MELSWMGRYRNIVRSLVRYSNTSNKYVKNASSHEEGLNQYQYQILEYICEHEQENKIMTDIARDLGLLKSNVTTATKVLVDLGLVEKYRISGNRKSIVLKPTELGKNTYLEYCSFVEPAFTDFFKCLSDVPDAELLVFENALELLSASWNNSFEQELEKIEDDNTCP